MQFSLITTATLLAITATLCASAPLLPPNLDPEGLRNYHDTTETIAAVVAGKSAALKDEPVPRCGVSKRDQDKAIKFGKNLLEKICGSTDPRLNDDYSLCRVGASKEYQEGGIRLQSLKDLRKKFCGSYGMEPKKTDLPPA